MGREPVGVDILTTIPGVEFDAAWPGRVEDLIDPATGLKASFISREDWIAAKLASGRGQDLADVEAIRKAAESQRPGTKSKGKFRDSVGARNQRARQVPKVCLK
jgi:hypothetical protein